VPGRCGLVLAGAPVFPCPGPARRSGSCARPVPGCGRGDHPVIGKTAGRAGGHSRGGGYRRVLRPPRPGAVHRLDAAGGLRRRQGDRDAARSAAPGYCRSRRPPRPDADPADPGPETLPQADGHPGLHSPGDPAAEDRAGCSAVTVATLPGEAIQIRPVWRTASSRSCGGSRNRHQGPCGHSPRCGLRAA
jgi:hypothetical protein